MHSGSECQCPRITRGQGDGVCDTHGHECLIPASRAAVGLTPARPYRDTGVNSRVRIVRLSRMNRIGTHTHTTEHAYKRGDFRQKYFDSFSGTEQYHATIGTDNGKCIARSRPQGCTDTRPAGAVKTRPVCRGASVAANRLSDVHGKCARTRSASPRAPSRCLLQAVPDGRTPLTSGGGRVSIAGGSVVVVDRPVRPTPRAREAR